VSLRRLSQPSNVSEPDEWRPTKKGINISVDSWQDFNELVEEIDQATGKKA